MASSRGPNIVVWEWEADNGQWIPYSPLNTKVIEREYHSSVWRKFSITISLQSLHRNVDYEIDLNLKIQRNKRSQNCRPIRRALYPALSAFANGWYWEWCKQSRKGQKHWTSYSVEVSDEIDRHYMQRDTSFRFQPHFNMDYEVNLTSKLQVNLSTHYKRSIRRCQRTDKYPISRSGQMNGTLTTTSPTHRNGNAFAHRPSHAWHGRTTTPAVSQPYRHTMPSSTSSQNPSNSLLGNFPLSQPPTSATAAPNPYPRQVPNAAPQNTVASSASVKKRKVEKPVTVPPCPPGGIPCNATASSVTVPVSRVLRGFTKKFDVDPASTDPCAICQSDLTDASGFGSSTETRQLSLCQHVFHQECLEASYSHGIQNGCIVCPTCMKMHGIKTGNQPDGTMRYSMMHHQLPGFSGSGTIRIEYHIRPGIQQKEHPHPGRSFSTPGFPRIGYLPNNNEGRRVLLLLIEAWKRRLIFTVGQSNTTGANDCVTWTTIHHKTELHSNRGHGYPDDTYLDRVTAELEAEGVTDDP